MPAPAAAVELTLAPHLAPPAPEPKLIAACATLDSCCGQHEAEAERACRDIARSASELGIAEPCAAAAASYCAR